jgi:hypothetical protein
VSCQLEFDPETMLESARAARDIYAADGENDFVYRRSVEQFSSFTGELVAGVRYLNEGRTAIVAVRGTSLIGNWIFTNVQAHFTQFNIVDDSLGAVPSTRYQGGAYRTPIEGSLHQGFFRAFSWLWYGTEPILGSIEGSRRLGVLRLRRYIAIFFLLPAILWTVSVPLAVSACIALLLAFAFVTTENGVWEDVFRLKPVISGDDPFRLLSALNSCDKVIFTGHSLGGAIAAIAFAMYRSWCKGADARRDNAILVTFGAPRIGDVPFMESFSSAHEGRFCHVVHPGDPVPEFPPNGLFELWHRRFWRRGPIGVAVVFFFPVWAAIGKLYVANRAARWEADGQCVLPGSSRLKIEDHSMENCYFKWASSLTRRSDASLKRSSNVRPQAGA